MSRSSFSRVLTRFLASSPPHLFSGGIIVFYDMLDKNLEVTAVGRDEEKLPVLDEDGAAVPGLFQMTSTMVTPGGFVQEKGAFDAEGGEEDEAAEQQNSISGSDAFNYTDMPFGSKVRHGMPNPLWGSATPKAPHILAGT